MCAFVSPSTTRPVSSRRSARAVSRRRAVLTPQDRLSRLAGPSPHIRQDVLYAAGRLSRRRTSPYAARRFLSTLTGRLSRCGTAVTLGRTVSSRALRASSGPCAALRLCAQPPDRAPGPALGTSWLLLLRQFPELGCSHLGMSCCSTAVKSLSSVLICENSVALVCQENTPNLTFSFKARSAILSSFGADPRTFLSERGLSGHLLTIPPPRLGLPLKGNCRHRAPAA